MNTAAASAGGTELRQLGTAVRHGVHYRLQRGGGANAMGFGLNRC